MQQGIELLPMTTKIRYRTHRRANEKSSVGRVHRLPLVILGLLANMKSHLLFPFHESEPNRPSILKA